MRSEVSGQWGLASPLKGSPAVSRPLSPQQQSNNRKLSVEERDKQELWSYLEEEKPLVNLGI